MTERIHDGKRKIERRRVGKNGGIHHWSNDIGCFVSVLSIYTYLASNLPLPQFFFLRYRSI
jgi:hypothetical protein